MNTSEFLMIASSVVPERDALVCEGRSLSFAQLQERVNRLANALQSLGLAKGDTVAVMALNSTATWRPTTPAPSSASSSSPSTTAPRRKARLHGEQLALQALFVGERYLDLGASPPPVRDRPALRLLRLHAGRHDALRGAALRPPARGAVRRGRRRRHTIIMYTSGTTAMPKGVVLTYLAMSVYVTNTMEPAGRRAATSPSSPCRSTTSPARPNDVHHLGRPHAGRPAAVRAPGLAGGRAGEKVTHASSCRPC